MEFLDGLIQLLDAFSYLQIDFITRYDGARKIVLEGDLRLEHDPRSHLVIDASADVGCLGRAGGEDTLVSLGALLVLLRLECAGLDRRLEGTHGGASHLTVLAAITAPDHSVLFPSVGVFGPAFRNFLFLIYPAKGLAIPRQELMDAIRFVEILLGLPGHGPRRSVERGTQPRSIEAS